MLNVFVDGDGQPQYVPIGNISDLRSIDATAVGGLPIADLEKAHDKQVGHDGNARLATCSASEKSVSVSA